MKEVCGMTPPRPTMHGASIACRKRTALLLGFGTDVVEIPAINLVFFQPEELWAAVYARFGAEFPIRFDFLDTMDGETSVYRSILLPDIYRSISECIIPRMKLLPAGCQGRSLRLPSSKRASTGTP